jgi:hypothetical protein
MVEGMVERRGGKSANFLWSCRGEEIEEGMAKGGEGNYRNNANGQRKFLFRAFHFCSLALNCPMKYSCREKNGFI